MEEGTKRANGSDDRRLTKRYCRQTRRARRSSIIRVFKFLYPPVPRNRSRTEQGKKRFKEKADTFLDFYLFEIIMLRSEPNRILENSLSILIRSF